MGKRHHKYDYFSAFEDLSELAVDEADLLIKAIEEFTTADALKETMEKAHAIEHKGDDINHDIFRNVATDFITPIDREDIIGLAQALDTIIDELLDVFEIKRSLSAKGCPYDNSVYESTNKILKAEFVCRERFSTLRELQAKLSDYVNWYNNFRLHSTLGYMSPVEFRLAGLTL